MKDHDTNAGARTDVANTAGHAGSSMDAISDHDHQNVNRGVTDFDKDTGTDERFEVETADRSSMTWLNSKRTYDLHQTMDAAELTAARVHAAKLNSLEVSEREQRLKHQAKLDALEIEMKQAEHNQRLRHADFQVTALAAVTGEMIEAIANRTADVVCRRINK